MNCKPALAIMFAVAITGCAGTGTSLLMKQETTRTKEAKTPKARPDSMDEEEMALRSHLAGLEGITSIKQQEGWIMITLGCDFIFDKDSATIRPPARGFNAMADTLKTYPKTQILVDAHTDCMHSEEKNLALSESRARAIKEALIARGIDASRIKARGWGEAKPTASNATAEGRRANRRVTITLLPFQSS